MHQHFHFNINTYAWDGDRNGPNETILILFLLPANRVANVMFSVVSVLHSVHMAGGRALIIEPWPCLPALSIQGFPPLCTLCKTLGLALLCTGPYPLEALGATTLYRARPQSYPPPQNMFKLVQYEACTVGKRSVGILMECFLYLLFLSSFVVGIIPEHINCTDTLPIYRLSFPQRTSLLRRIRLQRASGYNGQISLHQNHLLQC